MIKIAERFFWMAYNVTKQAIKDACHAYKRFLKGFAGYPRFKSRKHAVPKFYQNPVKIRFTHTHVKLEGFADSRKKNRQKQNWIRLAEQGCIPTEGGTYTNPRIKYDGRNWKNGNAGYSVPYRENRKKIRKGNVTGKQVTL